MHLKKDIDKNEGLNNHTSHVNCNFCVFGNSETTNLTTNSNCTTVMLLLPSFMGHTVSTYFVLIGKALLVNATITNE